MLFRSSGSSLCFVPFLSLVKVPCWSISLCDTPLRISLATLRNFCFIKRVAGLLVNKYHNCYKLMVMFNFFFFELYLAWCQYCYLGFLTNYLVYFCQSSFIPDADNLWVGLRVFMIRLARGHQYYQSFQTPCFYFHWISLLLSFIIYSSLHVNFRLFFFLTLAQTTINGPLSTVLAASQKSWYVAFYFYHLNILFFLLMYSLK